MLVEKIKSKIINFYPVTVWDILFFFLILVFSFFTFEHGDILHTGGSSLTYLNGHIRSFYEVNRQLFGENNYLPSTYIIFAIWNLPIKMFHLVKTPTLDVGAIIFWYKLLPTLFYAATAIVIYKIGLTIGLTKINSKLMAVFWVTTPIAFFSQFIFGQYDIFTVFFMLLGILCYLKKDAKGFIFFFAISLTFKYFPIFIFVPLLLLIEKKLLKLIVKLILFFVPIALEVSLYIHSNAFKLGVFGFSANQRLFTAGFQIVNGVNISVFLIIWFIICAFCYWKDTENNDHDLHKWSLYISMVVPSFLFGLILYNPQWLLFVTPFLAMTTFLHKKSNFFILVDLVMMFFFVGFVVNLFVNNVDQTLLNLGILRYLGINLASPTLIMKDIFLPHDIGLYYSVVTACFLINIIFKFPYKETNFFGSNLNELTIKNNWNLVRVRFFLGVCIFIIPAMATLFSHHLGTEIYNVSTASNISPISGSPIIKGVEYGQVFKAKTKKINAVKIQIGTFSRINSSMLIFKLQEYNSSGTGNIIYTKDINTSDIVDNKYLTIDTDVSVSPDKFYIFTLTSNDATIQNSVTVWHTPSNLIENESFATLNGIKQNFNLHYVILGN